MTLELAVLIAFTALMFLGTARTVGRVFEYIHAGQSVPTLLWRDVVERTGLALPFLLISMSRVLGLGGFLSKEDWWVAVTAAPALLSAGVYAYYEFFVIDTHQASE